jgi:hypothetical protein
LRLYKRIERKIEIYNSEYCIIARQNFGSIAIRRNQKQF